MYNLLEYENDKIAKIETFYVGQATTSNNKSMYTFYKELWYVDIARSEKICLIFFLDFFTLFIKGKIHYAYA